MAYGVQAEAACFGKVAVETQRTVNPLRTLKRKPVDRVRGGSTVNAGIEKAGSVAPDTTLRLPKSGGDGS